ncbi:MAG TPA: NERD domain-containing protein [Bacilli bacterium]|nr:NERD domain-containing protein [Bacilli bacterium]
MFYFFIAVIILTFVLRLPMVKNVLPKVKGFLGEGQVRIVLSRLKQDRYTVLYDLCVPNGKGGTSQIDHVVVSPYGIFVIETKNYKGLIYGSEQDQKWTQVINRYKTPFYNPVLQNKGHIKALQFVLEEFPEAPFFSIVAFSERATLKKVRVSSAVVTYSFRVGRVIRKHQKVLLSAADVQRISAKLRSANIVDRAARKDHVATIKETAATIEQQVASGTCPRCGGQLVERTGKYGSFLGCSGYPKCRFKAK